MEYVRGYTPQPGRGRLYKQAIIVTLVGNIVLVISKGLVAYLSGSVALYADTANSASDVLYSLLMVLGLWMSQRPPDMSHPQGHGRYEPLVGLIVGLSMGFAGYEAARASIERFIAGGMAVEPGLPTLVLVFSAAVKAGMYYFIRRIAEQLRSPALSATARDNLSDVLTSSAAFIGAFGSKFFHPLTDPIAGMAVAIWIFRNAFRALKENLYYITGGSAPVELRDKITQIAANTPGVLGVHHIMTEYTGPTLVVDMHINVDGKITLNEAHAIEDKVSEQIEALPEIDRAYVHVEPLGWKGTR